jgi:hypothetical protein
MADDLIYKVRIVYEVSLAKWRIDEDDNDWCLWVFDRNLGEWIPTNKLNRPGEDVEIVDIEFIK